MIKELNINDGKEFVIDKDLNLYFDIIFEAAGGKSCLKRNTAFRLLKMKLIL